MMTSSIPDVTASSTTYWMTGLSITGSISLGMALVWGRKRVPNPAAGMTAFRTLGKFFLILGYENYRELQENCQIKNLTRILIHFPMPQSFSVILPTDLQEL